MKYSAESLFITIKNSYIEDNTIKSAVYYIDHGRGALRMSKGWLINIEEVIVIQKKMEYTLRI